MRDQQALDPYFDRYTKTPLLTKDDEQRLGALVLAGRAAQVQLDANPKDPERRALQRAIKEGKAAQEQFVCANTRLVMSIARRYGWSSLELNDLVQEGILGLMHAAEMFDHTKGFKFSTYATWWIRQNIGKAIEWTGRPIRLPAYADEQVRKLANIRDDLLIELKREPTIPEMAKASHATAETVAMLLRSDQAVLSLDQETVMSVGAGNIFNVTTLADLIHDHSADPQEVLFSGLTDWDETQIGELMERLAPVQRRVLQLRYGGKGMSQKAVAEKLEITRAGLQSIERRALANLRILAGFEPTYEHGSATAFNSGCECEVCREGRNKRQREWNRRRQANRRAVAVSA